MKSEHVNIYLDKYEYQRLKELGFKLGTTNNSLTIRTLINSYWMYLMKGDRKTCN